MIYPDKLLIGQSYRYILVQREIQRVKLESNKLKQLLEVKSIKLRSDSKPIDERDVVIRD